MVLLEDQLVVKRSTLPDAGKGLFTKKFIPKGAKIVEYKGKISRWRDVDHKNGENGYIYYINRNHVINAGNYKKQFARYANDARGLQKVKGIINNAEYAEDGLHVYIRAKKDIPAGSEILVDYGKEYWDVIRYNNRINRKETRTK
jgi:SET domain-containing protein